MTTTATPSFKRTYNGDATRFTDGGWQVKGDIKVTNPNKLLTFTGVVVTDMIDDLGTCTVPGGAAVNISAGGEIVLPYYCVYTSAPNIIGGMNIATADWSAAKVSTPPRSLQAQAR